MICMVDACRYSIDRKSMAKKSYIEIELLNKDRILLHSDAWSKIYSLVEKKKVVVHFHKKFPFIFLETRPFVAFKVGTRYEYLDSVLYPTFKVNRSLREFMKLFDQEFVKFEETIVDYNVNQ